MYWKKKVAGLRYAITGLRIAWREESNFRFEVACAVLVILLAFFLDLPQSEFLIVIFAIGFILTAEAFNTALEELCDKFQPTHDPHIARIKDLAAAAVFISAITALVIGLIIFTPRLLALI